MKVLLDTNVLISCIGTRNKLRPIWDSFLEDRFQLILSTEIFFEYIEKLEEKTSVNFTSYISEYLRTSESVFVVRDWHRWNLIHIDLDDNKFLDVAIAGNADYFVTDDKQFSIVKPFPFYTKIISSDDFLQLISQS